MEKTLTSKDVTNVDISRMLKRNGVEQISTAYWYGSIPNLGTIQGMSALATEDKGKIRWLLIVGKPSQPCASAYTFDELNKLLMRETGNDKTKGVIIRQNPDNTFIGSIQGKDMFAGKTRQDILASVLLHFKKKRNN